VRLGGAAAYALADSLGQHSTFRTVVVPQAAQYLASSDVSDVQPDHPDDEQAVASKIVLRELCEDSRRPLCRVEGAQPPPHVLYLPSPVQRPEQPGQKVADGDDGHEYQPEPEENEDLLVEEVDGQRALYDVLVDAGLVTDSELAQCDAWKVLQSSPVQVTNQPLDDVQPVQAVFGSDERGDDEDLRDGVGSVDHLDDDVARDEIVAVVAAAKQAANLSDEVPDAHHTVAAEVALRDQIAVHLIDDVTNSFLAHLFMTSQN